MASSPSDPDSAHRPPGHSHYSDSFSRVGYSAQTPLPVSSPQTTIQVRRRAPSPAPYYHNNQEYSLSYSTSATYDSKDKPRRSRGLWNGGAGRIVTYVIFAFIITAFLYVVFWIVFGSFTPRLDSIPASHLEVELARVKEQLKRAQSEITLFKNEGVPQAVNPDTQAKKDLQVMLERQGDVVKKVYAEKAELALQLQSALSNVKTVIVEAPVPSTDIKPSPVIDSTASPSPKEEKNENAVVSELNLSNEQHAELVNQDDLKHEQPGLDNIKPVVEKDITEKVEDKPTKKDYSKITPVQVFRRLPSSSVWCEGTDKINRICRFRNLCFHPKHDSWFISKTSASEIHNVPENHFKEPLLELGTVAGHPYFGWNYQEINPYDPDFTNLPVRYETLPHFLFLRLHPRNIMHNLHDDVIPMYHHLKRWVGKGKLGMFSSAFDLDNHRMLMMDKLARSDSSRPFDYLSNYPMKYLRELKADGNVITCFRDAVAGNTKLTTWYQYGFRMPQGKIPGKNVNGLLVREVAAWIVRRNALPLTDVEKQLLDMSEETKTNEPKISNSSEKELDPEGTDLIVILSRKKNRIIINEQELAAHLTKEFGLKTVFVRNEDQNFEEQIQLLRRARVVVGMHGSILVMGMFCKIGTVLVEMFPYAVPSSNYTPYKSMAELPGMGLIYRAWENKWENASVPHPNNTKLHGGIAHLPQEMQDRIKNTLTVPPHICCADPFWLYRIYQDTRVNLPEITNLIRSGIEESRARKRSQNDAKKAFESYYKSQLDASNFIQRNEISQGRAKTPQPLDPVLSENIEFSIPATFNEYLVMAPKSPLSPPPVGNITCLESTLRKPGDLWIEWNRPWNHAPVDHYRVFITNTKKEYTIDARAVPVNTTVILGGWDGGERKEEGKKAVRLQSKTVSMSLPGFKPGEIVGAFVRPIVNDVRGESSKIECKV